MTGPGLVSTALICSAIAIWAWLRIRETWLLVCAFGLALIGARLAGAL